MTFDRRDLGAFLAVVDCGSLGRAALVMNMTQPSLSRRIRELEIRLGGPLFERHSKGMALTAAGETLLDHARLLVFEMEQAENALAELNGMQRGKLRLGAVAAVCRDAVPRALAAMAREFPDISIDLFEAPDGELAEALLERRLDLVVASGMLEDDDIEAVADFPLTDRFVPCSRGGGKSDRDIDDLLGRPWVMLRRGRTPRQLFEELVMAAGRKLPRVAIETNSVGAQIALVANSDLLGWLPTQLVSSEVAAGVLRLHPVPALTLERSFRIYRRRRAILGKPALFALEHLREVTGSVR
jgi:DNA-binding transcriptional LysR family regulator